MEIVETNGNDTSKLTAGTSSCAILCCVYVRVYNIERDERDERDREIFFKRIQSKTVRMRE